MTTVCSKGRWRAEVTGTWDNKDADQQAIKSVMQISVYQQEYIIIPKSYHFSRLQYSRGHLTAQTSRLMELQGDVCIKTKAEVVIEDIKWKLEHRDRKVK